VDFLAYVGDSSDTEKTCAEVRTVCAKFDFVRYHFHNGKNAAAARNFCAKVADVDLIISVDDDVYVEPDAIKRLVDAYHAARGARVVAGSVAWGDDWSTPVIMRSIGYGRKVIPGEPPSFLLSAFFIYPRTFALTWPWNERIRTSEDRFMGALWRSKGIQLLYEPRARAFHDQEHNTYDVTEQESHIYANLFDAFIANPNMVRLLSYEILGFAAGAKLYFRKPHSALAYIRAWVRGHKALWRDWEFLNQYRHLSVPDFE
jgi:glycosyltransferase involved in cell wall biosynthesis